MNKFDIAVGDVESTEALREVLCRRAVESLRTKHECLMSLSRDRADLIALVALRTFVNPKYPQYCLYKNIHTDRIHVIIPHD